MHLQAKGLMKSKDPYREIAAGDCSVVCSSHRKSRQRNRGYSEYVAVVTSVSNTVTFFTRTRPRVTRSRFALVSS